MPGNAEHTCSCGGSCGCQQDLSTQGMYLTREEYVAELEKYLQRLQEEVRSVEEELAGLQEAT